MHLHLGQLIKENLIQRVRDAKWFSILVDEVTDCATLECLLIYIGYVDEEGKTHFDFLEVKDVLETSESADSETLTRIITEELKACGLNLALVCGFGSDGASVMTGKNNGVGARLQKVCSIMVRSHCINHRLALACSDANDREVYPHHRSYPSSVVEVAGVPKTLFSICEGLCVTSENKAGLC